MNTKAITILCAILTLAACSKNEEATTDMPVTPNNDVAQTEQTIRFNLSASHPDDAAGTRGDKTGAWKWQSWGDETIVPAKTRAVKATWEAGDAIFVFFSNAAAPKHLKMTFDGSAWTSAEYDGATQTAAALGLKNGDTGTMRAVYLPFGSTATVSASGTSFTFSKTYYAYYLTATLSYTVANDEVSGAFAMTIPDDYVQFFVEDAAATDEAYTLGCDAVIPTGIASIAADGTVTETSDKTAADDMPGYSYSGGYLFSGKLTTWNYESNYYFAKTKASDNTRHDYFVTSKTLASHSAVKLPESGNSNWIQVGANQVIELKRADNISLGTWFTCNYGASRPEDAGELHGFYDYDDIYDPSNNCKPWGIDFDALNDRNGCLRTCLTIHGKEGMVVKAPTGLVFFPITDEGYWLGDNMQMDDEISVAWAYFVGANYKCTKLPWEEYKIRFLKKRGHNSIYDV